MGVGVGEHKLQIQVTMSSSHSMLSPGQTVLSLTYNDRRLAGYSREHMHSISH